MIDFDHKLIMTVTMIVTSEKILVQLTLPNGNLITSPEFTGPGIMEIHPSEEQRTSFALRLLHEVVEEALLKYPEYPHYR